MNPKEELVLNFRVVKIDKNNVIRAIQNTIDEIKKYFDSYGINKVVSSDLYSYVEIENYARIEIQYDDKGKNVAFSLKWFSVDKKSDVWISLSAKGRMFTVSYMNCNVQSKSYYFINEQAIEDIFKDLIKLNKE
ncbi:hypothetical protein CPJCM30710_05470 [Clostridium polyendosporum]|uniref:Uncharacterized protein n=1 Tax=Clostridium polyendosporum TaxID=69208 RepID=A0A919RY51_9CLOT|nr:hypothetical protein [Clostridium polyendosporum]GIM27881.1 hypothetical protein CPJCM30710_05470 [Clostridium polyendosporum]